MYFLAGVGLTPCEIVLQKKVLHMEADPPAAAEIEDAPGDQALAIVVIGDDAAVAADDEIDPAILGLPTGKAVRRRRMRLPVLPCGRHETRACQLGCWSHQQSPALQHEALDALVVRPRTGVAHGDAQGRRCTPWSHRPRRMAHFTGGRYIIRFRN